LKRVRKVKVTVFVKDQTVGSSSVLAKEDRVLTTVRVVYDSVRRRYQNWNKSNVLNRRGMVEIGGDTLNFRCSSNQRADVTDVNLVV
jgi:ribonuclease PH